ncbi:MAG: polysaccharide biosynthesis protein [Patescibacteria group bacterium]
MTELDIADQFKGKRILVTGGSGSIGSIIVKELLKYNPRQIRVYGRDETKQLELMQMMGADARMRFLIGDVRDKDRLMLAMEDIDIVFHAAAMKHVVFCENNPFEAVKTNVLGTQNLIDCAFARNVERVIGISTDKATDPTNVMGCTKLLSEKLMLASYHYKGNKRTRFSFVRFGNVLWSRGSVLTLWQEQIRRGEAVTVTDPSMTRFFMPLSSTVSLVFRAVHLMHDREIFILKMPAVYIRDMAQAMVNVYAPRYGKDPKDITIEVIGKKAGERLHEKLLSSEEAEYALETDDMFIVTPVIGTTAEERERFLGLYPEAAPAPQNEFTTREQEKLSLPAIEQMIRADDQDFLHSWMKRNDQ